MPGPRRLITSSPPGSRTTLVSHVRDPCPQGVQSAQRSLNVAKWKVIRNHQLQIAHDLNRTGRKDSAPTRHRWRSVGDVPAGGG
jgi:hypothetical protein